MIPHNISRNDIIAAINQIEIEGVPPKRKSRKYYMHINGKYYPPKYVISLANHEANGIELSPAAFCGGNETNGYLCELGFDIVSHD